MQRDRRRFLIGAGAGLTAALAGCNTQSEEETTATESAADGESTGTDAATDGAAATSVGAATAVAAEWTAMRARLFDAVALAAAGRPAAGAAVTQSVFARFENASGEWGAHEQLEHTNADNYETFEANLSRLSEALSAGEVAEAREAAVAASDNLRAAALGRTDQPTAHALELQLLGTHVRNAGLLAAAGHTDGAVAVGQATLTAFEQAAVHDAVEETAPEAYETFEGELKATVAAAEAGDGAAAHEASEASLSAAVEGSYALADAQTAGAGELAVAQARAFDATAVSSLGGPGVGLAHATTLTSYRAQAYDAVRLADAGETDAASALLREVFADFEGATAHDPFEEADAESYEAFERGLSALRSAVENGEATAEPLATVDESLLAGVTALGGQQATTLEAAFFRARFSDARQAYATGDGETAAALAESLFERFEQNEAGVHEALEETSAELYESFEDEHLSGLIEAFRAGDDEAVATHYDGVQSALFEFQTQFAGTAAVSAAGAAYMDARVFDGVAAAHVGDGERGASLVGSAFEYFESGAGGFHEALEEADAETYETFESELGAVRSAIESDGDATAAGLAFHDRAVAAATAVVGAGTGGSLDGLPGTAAQATFQAFEAARVHETLEEADGETYESFEAALGEFVGAVQDGGDAAGAVSTFADHAARAQFAVVGGLGKAPAVAGASMDSGESDESEASGDTEYEGGPNVVSADEVPEDATVVDLQAVAFTPETVTVSAGDTIAFVHAGGEAHNVVAYADQTPEGAPEWNSAGADSESAAVEAWEEGRGAVVSGRAYVRTFETVGEHGYYCTPHEMAGMVGTVIVEE
ncbi:DUF5059 domain-containing protein [Halobaculum sp. MBLA0143]|uniref:DUF5059 domain-containing protein n=1 Tax=Halobaculum sp. MBLA0143 TaxID=3079933 RepID=UPI0035240598